MDATEFFRTGANFLADTASSNAEEAARCGRSSVIRIRHENRGRVLNSVVKFSGPGSVRETAASAAATTQPASTPKRRVGAASGSGLTVPVSGARRMSARMGVSANITPSVLPLNSSGATTR